MFVHRVTLARRQVGPCGLRLKLQPAYLFITLGRGFTQQLFITERQAGKAMNINFIFFGLTRQRIEPESIISAADALFQSATDR